MADQNPYRQAREVENDALGRMTGPSPKEVGWDEGFAAGRAAATPDPHDWSAAILTLRQAMCTPAGREQVERELLRPFAASPDERLREAAERLTRAVEVLDLSDPRLDDAGPYETLTVPQSAAAWRDIRRFVAEARSALAAADREKPETDT